MFRVFWKVFRGVPGFLEGVPGCSGFSRRCSGVFRVSHTVPGVPGCSGGVSVFRVPVVLELLHAAEFDPNYSESYNTHTNKNSKSIRIS